MFNPCNTTVCPPIVHPTQCCVNHTVSNVIVPEIHPSHTTTVNHENIIHEHYFPHTTSVVNEVSTQNVIMPGPGPGFGGVPGPGFGPGFGGVPGPGFGPGAGFGPGPGFY
ncbi:CotD family spore coat protein [Lederbergia citri]|uniref:Spore coat protein CotH n=1 Tax=Lederbergia citri TaxID=2833580 RepID=A0A942YFG3_9BACI|nr:CotD family spore coat protein [Lederbergia citri]MBS4194462.1 spore coat protein CotH [Lederbergia citri]